MKRSIFASCTLGLILALSEKAHPAGQVSFKDCLKGIQPIDQGAQLVVSAAANQSSRLKEVLKSSGLQCAAQLQIDGACLVQVIPPAGESAESTATILGKNIFALRGGFAPPEIQAVIGEVSVNAGPAAHSGTAISTIPLPQVTTSKADPMWAKQVELQWMGAEDAWFDLRPSTALTAIVDTGVRVTHKDLQKQFVAGVSVNCAFGKCDGTPRRDWTEGNLFHGTQLAGILAARQGNPVGGIGVAHKAKFISINYGPVFRDFYLACSIQYARASKAKVINLSWEGSDAFLSKVAKQVDAAEAEGILIVVAAGDETIDLDNNRTYPATLKNGNLLTVMGFDVDTQSAGASTNIGHIAVDLAAPDRAGWTTSIHDKKDLDAEGRTESAGTSWSAAYVSGAAALLESRYPDSGHDFLKWRIIANATPFDDLKGKSRSGGVLNLARTMFPVTAADGHISRATGGVVNWSSGIRGDMCAQVSIEGRFVTGQQPGAYFSMMASTDNDGREHLPHSAIPASADKLIQLKVQCLGARPTAESSPIPLQ